MYLISNIIQILYKPKYFVNTAIIYFYNKKKLKL